MDSDSLDDLRARAREIRANTVSRSSRAVYSQSYARYITWAFVHQPTLITLEFSDAVGDTQLPPSELRARIRSILAAGDVRPIYFDQLEATDFVSWLLTLKKRDGSNLSYSSLNTHRSGLFNLFREHGSVMTTALSTELATYFKGFKRSIARRPLAFPMVETRSKLGSRPCPLNCTNSFVKHCCLVPKRT